MFNLHYPISYIPPSGLISLKGQRSSTHTIKLTKNPFLVAKHHTVTGFRETKEQNHFRVKPARKDDFTSKWIQTIFFAKCLVNKLSMEGTQNDVMHAL